LIAATPNEAPREKGGGKGGQGGGAGVEPAVVPAYLFNVWLCQPGADSVSVSLLAWQPMEAFLSYGESAQPLTQRTEAIKLASGEPKSLVLGQLKPDTRYAYQLTYKLVGGAAVQDEVRNFHTQRAPASTFSFVTQADSHLDTSTDARVYQQTLANMLADKPDFMVDLGDTTMVDKFGNFYTRAASQYLAQRYYMGRIAHSVPVFFTLGNHDGERGERLTGKPDSMPLWSVGMRKKFFPNPEPGGIYTGNATPFEGAGLLQDYYAWEWGSALFVVLDPFWPTMQRKGEDNWNMTLGEAQYRWLTKTLETSKAPFMFVFIHHLVGGLGRDVRGGAKTAPYMEWGGRNADVTDGFARHRPGWDLPIHQLLVKHGVSIVFHGHDHLFVKEELDGIIYQEVPQPGHPSGGTRSAEEYGYGGVILGSSGYVRVTVGPREAKVDYVRSIVPGVTRGSIENGAVEHSYTLQGRR
jgi:predicted phosphodiesterase